MWASIIVKAGWRGYLQFLFHCGDQELVEFPGLVEGLHHGQILQVVMDEIVAANGYIDYRLGDQVGSGLFPQI